MIAHAILALAALLTAVISGIIGMGGGILLLAVLLSFLPHAEAIPAHGAVQLVSNGTRLLAFIRHVDWKTIARFAAGAVPGSIVGGVAMIWLQAHIDATDAYLKIAIGSYVLIMTFRPTLPPAAVNAASAVQIGRRFTRFGFLAGMLGLTVGAIGPLIAPVFVHCGFVKERLIATKAVCQALVHLLKVPIFLAGGLVAYGTLGRLILIMSLMVIPGTLIGKRILTHVDDRMFVRLFRIAMALAGIKVLAYDGLYRLGESVWR